MLGCHSTLSHPRLQHGCLAYETRLARYCISCQLQSHLSGLQSNCGFCRQYFCPLVEFPLSAAALALQPRLLPKENICPGV